jgi:hypothetical protein
MSPFVRILAVLALLAGSGAGAQVGPIEPILIANAKPSEALAKIPDTSQDYLVRFEAVIGADGIVKEVVITTPTGNEKVDASVVRFLEEKRFLPALDASAQPVEARVPGTVEFRSKSMSKLLKLNLAPPDTRKEVARVRKLACKDFAWEADRLRREGGVEDLSRAIMPWVSLRVYLVDRKLPVESESTLMPKWPAALAQAEQACRAAPAKMYLDGVLAPLLDAARQ